MQGPLGYILHTVGSREIDSGRPGGVRNYVHGINQFDFDVKSSPQLGATLRRGVTVRGRLVSPEGKPVEEAVLSSYLLLPPFGRDGRVAAFWEGEASYGQFKDTVSPLL